jgi:hypothetical protein
MHIFISLVLFSFSLFAQTITLEEYRTPIPDIAERHFIKEDLFQKMNRRLVKVNDSICSNRAHVWAYDFQKHGIASPKIFLFFTPKTSRRDGISWWYHVSPIVNEKGSFFVMDAGFPRTIKRPLTVEEWLMEFNGKDSRCKEIKDEDTDLVERMFSESSFPESTKHGKYDCYYKITPAGYWTPAQVAKNVLGKDENGRPVRVVRDEFNRDEVFEACLEASTNPLGWAWGSTLRKCQYFVNH